MKKSQTSICGLDETESNDKRKGVKPVKIGIDIDDTTFLTVKSMLKYADQYEEEISGIPTNRDSFGLIKNRYYLKVLYGWDDTTKFAFFQKYYKNVLEECELLPDADKVIQQFK